MKRALAFVAALVFATGALAQQLPPSATPVTVQSAATTNATSTKASAGVLYGYSLCNTTVAAGDVVGGFDYK